MENGLTNSSKRSLKISLRSPKRNLKKNPARVDIVSPNWRVKELPFTGVGGEGPRGESDPQKFWIIENLGKIPENPGKNGTKRCLTSKHGAESWYRHLRYSDSLLFLNFFWVCWLVGPLQLHFALPGSNL